MKHLLVPCYTVSAIPCSHVRHDSSHEAALTVFLEQRLQNLTAKHLLACVLWAVLLLTFLEGLQAWVWMALLTTTKVHLQYPRDRFNAATICLVQSNAWLLLKVLSLCSLWFCKSQLCPNLIYTMKTSQGSDISNYKTQTVFKSRMQWYKGFLYHFVWFGLINYTYGFLYLRCMSAGLLVPALRYSGSLANVHWGLHRRIAQQFLGFRRYGWLRMSLEDCRIIASFYICGVRTHYCTLRNGISTAALLVQVAQCCEVCI